MPTIFVLNGANINMVGMREPDIYGTRSYADICGDLRHHADARGAEVDIRQSNAESDLIDWLQESHTKADGVILNAGGFTRTSLAILDAIKAIRPPVVELHLSNLFHRDSFRPPSFVSHGACGLITGFGGHGYVLALDAILQVVRDRAAAIARGS
jgi:3-dehydroquinate dehydratase-2